MKKETAMKRIARKVYRFATACIMLLAIALQVILVMVIVGILTGGSEICQTIAVNGAMGGIISTEMSISNLFDKIECKLFGCKSWEVSV